MPSTNQSIGHLFAPRRWVIEQMIRAYQLNEPVLTSMQRWSQAAQASTFVDAVFAVATVYIVLLN